MVSKTTLLIVSLLLALGMTSACTTTPVSNEPLGNTPPALQYSPAAQLDGL
jgi:hypothetical protein